MLKNYYENPDETASLNDVLLAAEVKAKLSSGTYGVLKEAAGERRDGLSFRQ